MSSRKPIKKPVKYGIAKVPVIMQLEALECGAACLTMVLAYYDKWIPLEEVRRDCGVSRDGSNLLYMKKAAINYGLNVDVYKVEPEEVEKQGTFPCILHWGFCHFVVCDGFKGDKVYLNDPARGQIQVSRQEFDEKFTGIMMVFKPSKEFVPSGKKKSVLGFAKKRMKGTSTAVTFVVLTTIITSLVSVILLAFSKFFLDELLSGRNVQLFIPFISGLIILSLIQIATNWIKTINMLKINGKLAVIGSTTYFWNVLHKPMEFFSQRMTGDLLGRQGENAGIANTLVQTAAPLALNTIMAIFYLIMMLNYNVILSLIGLVSLFGNMYFSRLISKKRINVTRVMMRDSGKLSSSTVSGIEMIETIKASGAENGYFEKWAGYQASVNSSKVKYSKVDAYLGMLPSILSQIVNTVILIVGVYLVINGDFTIGMIMAFQGFLGQFMNPATQLISAGQTIQEMTTSMERIEDVMEYPEDTMYAAEKRRRKVDTDRKLSGTLTMKNVTFGYSKLANPLIENFDIELKQGSKVAFVGASGCGKSTLAKLISGLYEEWSGDILFDGKPIKEIDRNVFTSSVAVVDQDITLFEDTISNNIKMWDNSIEDYEVILAARDAQIHEDIMKREEGYNYKILENGKDFSGGQRQRLEIARVLAQDPTLIIMDEATSALDAKTEYEVVKAINDRGITCVIVAHRLSTIRDCDEIIVLDKGKVVERGTHNELMANGKYYKELVTNE